MSSRWEKVKLLLETGIAGALLLWRAFHAGSEFWKDWLFGVACFWIIVIHCQTPRRIGIVATGIAAALLVLYLWGQTPHVLKTLGCQP